MGMRRAALLSCVVLMLCCAGCVSPVADAGASEDDIRLWPLIYRTPSETDILFSVAGFKDDGSAHVFPVFWGEDYFHVAPLVWTWDDNIIAAPLGWRVHGNQGVGLVWWGDDYFHVPPVLWHWRDLTLVLPLDWTDIVLLRGPQAEAGGADR